MEYLATAGALGIIIFIAFLIWSFVWKGWALWIAAKQDEKKWFIALLVLNTVGILEILYIFYFSRKSSHSTENEKELVVEIERG